MVQQNRKRLGDLPGGNPRCPHLRRSCQASDSLPEQSNDLGLCPGTHWDKAERRELLWGPTRAVEETQRHLKAKEGELTCHLVLPPPVSTSLTCPSSPWLDLATSKPRLALQDTPATCSPCPCPSRPYPQVSPSAYLCL